MGGLRGTQWASRFGLVIDTGMPSNERLAACDRDLGLPRTEHDNGVIQDRGV
jgi:hypothetical protein